ncbi:helix-turn-helix domain-containing protein [Pedobacter sp. MW01-1-1]|uniref:helix-turn-helix domain-containing protein n=1 Tax=Pedobacter sp. MW01-1-1 TaxID=3383027 RepID=UPI003FEDAD02
MTDSEILLTQKEILIKDDTIFEINEFGVAGTVFQQHICFSTYAIQEYSGDKLKQITISNNKRGVLLHFCKQGKSRLRLASQDSSFQIVAGEYNVFALNNGQTILTLGKSNCSVLHIYLSDDFFSMNTPEAYTFTTLKMRTYGRLSKKNLCILRDMKALLLEMTHCDLNNDLKKFYTKAKIIELLCLQIAQVQQEKQSSLSGLTEVEIEKMRTVKMLIETNLSENQTISSLAKAVSTNEQYLKKHFKQVYGNTILRHAIACKMEKAKKLILSNRYRIAEVAEKVGYKYATHFTNAFKKYFGYVPQDLKTFFIGSFYMGLEFDILELLVVA